VHRLRHYPDEEAVFMHCFADADTAFWLDSSAAEVPQGRFSYMGDARGPAAEVVTYRSAQRELQVQSPAHKPTDVHATGSILDYLEAGLARRSVPQGDWPLDFVGGYVGYFGYERAGAAGPKSSRSGAYSRAAFALLGKRRDVATIGSRARRK